MLHPFLRHRALGLITLVASFAAPALFMRLGDKSTRLGGVCFYAPLSIGAVMVVVAAARAFQGQGRATSFNIVVSASAALLSTSVMFGAIAFEALFSDQPDPFGRDLVIPEGLHMRAPSEAPPAAFMCAHGDPDGDAIKAACASQPTAASRKVSFELSALDATVGERARAWEAKLRRDPAWAVSEERGKRYAYRRFQRTLTRADVFDDAQAPAASGVIWESSLNGFASPGECQVRIVIGFEGPVFADHWRPNAITRSSASAHELELQTESSAGGRGPSSYLVLQSSQIGVEIYDESRSEDRAVTRAALALVEHALAADGGEPEPAYTAQSTLDVVQGMQGGMYTVYAQLNPGEPGYAYLRVYEHTRNTRLSEDRIGERSKRFVGWSSAPSERFAYQADITVYEGDWGVYYPGRFELWFVPESGAAERKLLEDVFRVEGWQR